jgi:flavin reductase (DIM6/NTAB) family NADH-FMN oxidoreductase RutF
MARELDQLEDEEPSGDALQERFRAAMRGTASGVAVLATDGSAGRAGVTVSTLCSLSLQPPSVIACVHRDSRALGRIMSNKAFVANVLAEDQKDIAEIFAEPNLGFDIRFALGEWHTLATGAPALDGAIASFDCRLATTFDFGSHRILIGEVVEVAARRTNPLVYSGRMFQRIRA